VGVVVQGSIEVDAPIGASVEFIGAFINSDDVALRVEGAAPLIRTSFDAERDGIRVSDGDKVHKTKTHKAEMHKAEVNISAARALTSRVGRPRRHERSHPCVNGGWGTVLFGANLGYGGRSGLSEA
jgi:hypothetical protein